MLEDGRITYRQLMLLIIISRLLITITYLPAFNIPPYNQDVWISTGLSFPLQLLLAIPAYLLAQRFRDRSIVQAAEAVLGKGGKLVGGLYVWFFIHITAITLRQFGEFLVAAPYPETPIMVFIAGTTLVAAFAVQNGVETISCFGEIVAPVILISIIMVVAMVAKDMDFKTFLPVLEAGVFPALHGAFIIAARTTEVLFVAMLIPYLNRPRAAKKAVVLGMLLISMYLVIMSAATIANFGVEQARSRVFPFFSLVRLISIGNFLERIDAVLLGIWVLGAYTKTAIYYYLAVLGAAQLLNLKDYRPIVLPVGAIAASLSILQARSLVEFQEFTLYKTYTWYVLFFVMALPLFLLLVAVVRRKGVGTG